MCIRRGDGNSVWVETVYVPIKDTSGRVECVLGVMRDVSDSKHREDSLRGVIDNLRDEVGRLREEIQEQYGIDSILARSAAMKTVLEKIRTAAASNRPVLISGESGSGKEWVARAIHHAGMQKDGPFLSSACVTSFPERIEQELFGEVRNGSGDITPGLLCNESEGTLYLGEITGLTDESQVYLLRALQSRRVRPRGADRELPVTARVVAATEQNVTEAISRGELRQDLFYGLNVISIEIPPLRERREDIPYLVGHQIDLYNEQHLRAIQGVEDRAWALLMAYDWPGNVRELHNAVESAMAVGTGAMLRAEDLPAEVRGETLTVIGDSPSQLNLDRSLRDLERQVIGNALRHAGSQRSRAAKLMGISRSRLYRRMDALNIDPNQVH